MKKVIISALLACSLFGAIGEGEKAADFTLTSLDGTHSRSMADFKGEVVLLNLWASWCDGCKHEMPEFFTLQQAFGSGFKIVTVSIDKKPEASQEFLGSVEDAMGTKTPFVTLYDPKKTLPKAYGAVAMPSSYLIDKNGVVKRVIVGSLDAEGIAALKREIESLK